MNETNTLPTVERDQPPSQIARQSATPADLVRYAMDTNADLDRLEKLMAMQQKWEEHEARKAFVADMAEFKRNPPEIMKDTHVEFRTDRGITSYWHASIGTVVEKIVAGLSEHGFSHRWIPERVEGGIIRITCVITHKLGHSESTTLEAGLDASGGKNNIQAMISTKTYLERHSLLAATGLATKDMTDDYDQKEGERRAAESTRKAGTTKQEQKTPEPWPADKFAATMSKEGKMVLAGTKTAADLLAWMQTKAPLTDEQKAAVLALRPVQADPKCEPEIMASADQLALIRANMEDLGIADTDVCKRFNLASLDALPASMVEAVAQFIADPIGA